MATHSEDKAIMSRIIWVGAVAYDPKVVTIWEGFRSYFARQGLLMDYVLYSNYERQVEALVNGQIHVAWNSPLAWVRAHRLAEARGLHVRSIAMRDTDCDLNSVVVGRERTNRCGRRSRFASGNPAPTCASTQPRARPAFRSGNPTA